MSRVDRAGQSLNQTRRRAGWLWRPFQVFGQARPIHELHRKKRTTVLLADIVNLNNIRVGNWATASASAQKAGKLGRARVLAGQDHLERRPAGSAQPAWPCKPHPCRRGPALPKLRSRRPWVGTQAIYFRTRVTTHAARHCRPGYPEADPTRSPDALQKVDLARRQSSGSVRRNPRTPDSRHPARAARSSYDHGSGARGSWPAASGTGEVSSADTRWPSCQRWRCSALKTSTRSNNCDCSLSMQALRTPNADDDGSSPN